MHILYIPNDKIKLHDREFTATLIVCMFMNMTEITSNAQRYPLLKYSFLPSNLFAAP